MMKRSKPSERNARTNQVVSIVAVRTIHQVAANDRGAFSYLRLRPSVTRIERVVGKGQYLGDGKKVSAFVWLDSEPAVLKVA
jgi:hypothetical protein